MANNDSSKTQHEGNSKDKPNPHPTGGTNANPSKGADPKPDGAGDLTTYDS